MSEFNPSSAGYLRIHALLGQGPGANSTTSEPLDRVDDQDLGPIQADAPRPPTGPREVRENEVYIDRGPALPSRYGGRRLRAMIQDPHTLFVYWNLEDEADKVRPDAWVVDVLDPEGLRLESIETNTMVNSLYIHIAPSSLGRILLRPIHGGVHHDSVAEVLFRTPTATASERGEELWAQASQVSDVFQSGTSELLALRRASHDHPRIELKPVDGPGATAAHEPVFPVTRPFTPYQASSGRIPRDRILS